MKLKWPRSARAAFTALLVIGSTLAPIVGILAYEKYRSRQFAADIVARAPEKGNYSPQSFTLPVGRKSVIRIRNIDTVVHGFAVPGLGVDAGQIKAGHVALVAVTPEKTGDFPFYCTVWCSEFHLNMRGVIHVVEE